MGAGLLDMYKMRHELHSNDMAILAVGIIVAFVSALIVIRALIRYVSKHDFTAFAYYRIVLVYLFWRHGGQVGCIGNADDLLVSDGVRGAISTTSNPFSSLDVELKGQIVEKVNARFLRLNPEMALVLDEDGLSLAANGMKMQPDWRAEIPRLKRAI